MDKKINSTNQDNRSNNLQGRSYPKKKMKKKKNEKLHFHIKSTIMEILLTNHAVQQYIV